MFSRPRRTGRLTAPQFEPGVPQYAPFSQSPQLPHFNVGKKIMKPAFPDAGTQLPPGFVPVRNKEFLGDSISQVKMTTKPPTQKGFTMETTEPAYVAPPPVYQYDAGIRPSARILGSAP